MFINECSLNHNAAPWRRQAERREAERSPRTPERRVKAVKLALGEPAARDPRRLRVLQFLIHLVGDVDPLLQVCDDSETGGNGPARQIERPACGLASSRQGHRLVERPDPAALNRALQGNRDAQAKNDSRSMDTIAPACGSGERRGHRRAKGVARLERADAYALANALSAPGARQSAMRIGRTVDSDPDAWALEAHALARRDADGRLRKPDTRGVYQLTAGYARHANPTIAPRLARAGIRLAALWNQSLPAQPASARATLPVYNGRPLSKATQQARPASPSSTPSQLASSYLPPFSSAR